MMKPTIYKKPCEKCGILITTKYNHKRFCDTCKSRRHKEYMKEKNHRKRLGDNRYARLVLNYNR